MGTKVTNDLSQKFNKGTIWVHWLTALFIIVLLLSSFKVAGFETLERTTMVITHLFLGGLVFIFTIVRSFILLKKEQPAHLKTGSKFIDKLAKANHYLFYLLLFAISITGFIVLFTGNYIEALSNGNMDLILPGKQIPIFKYHVLILLLVVLLLVMHLIGVIKHYLFTKENTLKRIV